MKYAEGYIGSYTLGAKGRGIYRFKLDLINGTLRDLALSAETDNPSYLAVSSSKKYLYAVNETSEYQGRASGSVSSFRIDPDTGALTQISRKISGGKHPCQAVLSPEDKYLVAANYTSGTISLFPLEAGGGLGEAVQIIQFSGQGPHPERQEGPHAHSFMFDLEGKYGFACDLGTDRLMIYAYNPKASLPLTPADLPICYFKPGAGPRQGIMHPAGDSGYFLNELDSTIDVLRYDRRGGFEKIQSLRTLPQGLEIPNTGAALKISPEGQFLYASNRGHDSIAIFAGQPDRTLEWVGAVPSGGKTPRDFGLDPTGAFLLVCHQDSDNLTVFRRNPKTGLLKQIQEYPLPGGVCLLFL
jgi:6-phosphogluconolactonase